MIKAVLFDVDGVLLNSFEGNLRFFNFVIRNFGKKPMTRRQYRQLYSTPSDKVFLHNFPEKNNKEMKEIIRYGSKVAPDFYKYIRINPGVIYTLEKLKKQGFRMGIVTNRKKMRILSYLSLNKYFKTKVGYLDVKNRKPYPEPIYLALKRMGVQPEEAVYVGDLLSDFQAANKAGVKVIIYRNPKVGGDYNISDFRKILKIIEGLNSKVVVF
ncbi:MAG: HAD family hydrolase [Candidatus Aenigmarchaeota archaeon]|nr:HAD family hydrolase [Candidatus Aenigmarchaeota archaeon]